MPRAQAARERVQLDAGPTASTSTSGRHSTTPLLSRPLRTILRPLRPLRNIDRYDLGLGPTPTIDSSLSLTLPEDTPWWHHSRRARRGRMRRCMSASDEEAADVPELAPGPVHHIAIENDFAAARSRGRVLDGLPSPPTAPVVPAMMPPTPRTRRSGLWAWLEPVRLFSDLRFTDAAVERRFQHEQWAAEKKSAMFGALFLNLHWLLGCVLFKDYSLFNYYGYIGIVGLFTVPLPFLVAFDGPRRFQWFYQPVLMVAAWVWGFLQTIEMKQCGYYSNGPCADRSFLHVFGSLFGLPSIAIAGMRQNRVLHVVAAAVYLIMSCNLLLREPEVTRAWVRNPVTLLIYHMYLAMINYLRERGDRQLYSLRRQLKQQYNAVAEAQVMERRAEHSKKQFVSYIFHEVRVPLNTALLAVQNLEGEGVFERLGEDESGMMHGLVSSLGMMEKVLNDVLSFNRMESGQLTLASAPFDLHQAIKLVALPHRAQAAKGVEFNVELDPRIDDVGLLVGDEMRLRQLASNLVSNALKFTNEGSVTIATKLLFPDDNSYARLDASSDKSDTSATDVEKGSLDAEAVRYAYSFAPRSRDSSHARSVAQSGHSRAHSLHSRARSSRDVPQKYAVIRIEVRDTGPGVAPADVKDNRLFSPYFQTEIGARQGGKGSGLGLALVLQLVKLSEGRFGVDSDLGRGSTFWFELQYPTTERPAAPEGPILEGLRRCRSPAVISPAVIVASTPESEPAPPPVNEEAVANLTPPVLARGAAQHEAAISPSPPGEPNPRPSDPLRALVVDDNTLTRALMSRMLKRLGAGVRTAEHGKAALQMLDKGSYDVVFLDNQMPHMSGLEVVSTLRHRGSSLYVVGCTGNALHSDQAAYLAAGADVVLPKPVHERDLVLALQVAAERRARGRDVERMQHEEADGARDGERIAGDSEGVSELSGGISGEEPGPRGGDTGAETDSGSATVAGTSPSASGAERRSSDAVGNADSRILDVSE